MIVIQKSDLSYEDLDKFLKSIKYLENNIRENPDKFNMELNNELREIYHILYLVKKQNPHINLKSEINKILNNPNYDGIIGYFIHNNKAIFYVKYGDKIYIPHYNVIFLASMFLEHNVSVDNVKLSIAKEQRGTLYIRVISPELKKRNFYYLFNGKYTVDDNGYLMDGPRKKVKSFLNIKILGMENNDSIINNSEENSNPIGIVAKLAWSFNRWEGLSPDLKEFKFRDRYGFEFVKKWGYAHEFWNFNEDFNSKYYYGCMTGKVNNFREGLIIFISKNIEDGKWYFVGLYGKGKYLETPKDTGIKMSDLLPEKIIEHN
ncbi:hypothetical protein [Methanocaldococcus sp.]|uniref:hypothetical protein n=1 Tax=Methanocaldococcus sp. TaxID=2152917 RepID=UPI00262F025E|nr:hypothetical protein [Methanocaldococcus sp.]MCQ6253578.1 hypothetical protein [Methanocaldococcus sp.]